MYLCYMKKILLKANENFLRLQAELEGTENRIKTARDRYNGSVNPYNMHILSFPNSFINTRFEPRIFINRNSKGYSIMI